MIEHRPTLPKPQKSWPYMTSWLCQLPPWARVLSGESCFSLFWNVSLPLKGSHGPGGFSLELLVCDLKWPSTKRKTFAGWVLSVQSILTRSKQDQPVDINIFLNGVNMKVREIEEPKSTSKTPFPGCVYTVGIVHHLSSIDHNEKPSLCIFKRGRESTTSLCGVPC